MLYLKEFDIQLGDRVKISMPANYPFPEGWAEGTVLTVSHYDDEGWLIEFVKDKVSSGWQTGYGYWKQNTDGGTVVKIKTIPEVYPSNIMGFVRGMLGLDSSDTSRDEEIANMSKGEVFAKVLQWEGIIGYDYKILVWIKEIYGVNVE